MGKEYRRAKKEFLYTIIVGDFYSWNVYRITDAAKYSYFVAHPIKHGGTVLADEEKDIRPQLEKQVPILNSFLARVK